MAVTNTPVDPDNRPVGSATSWTDILSSLLDRRDLTRDEAMWAMDRISSGAATPAQTAGFATALRAKGETAVEIAGLVSALRARADTVAIPGPTADIAGTGGDGTGAVNISTVAAIVAAATGVTVVKHGGRNASSSTGAADLVERLGVSLDVTPPQAARVVAEAGITFLFAPRFNPGLRHAAAVRRELGVPTVFNVLGPLLNPARPRHQVIGVADARMAPLVADVLATDGTDALVVRGRDGLDKLTTVTTSDVWEVRAGAVTRSLLDPRDLGFERADPAALRGGDAADNARTALSVLSGARSAVRDVVILNAAAVLVAVAAADEPLPTRFATATARCAEAIDTGAARLALDRWVHASRRMESTTRSTARSR